MGQSEINLISNGPQLIVTLNPIYPPITPPLTGVAGFAGLIVTDKNRFIYNGFICVHYEFINIYYILEYSYCTLVINLILVFLLYINDSGEVNGVTYCYLIKRYL